MAPGSLPVAGLQMMGQGMMGAPGVPGGMMAPGTVAGVPHMMGGIPAAPLPVSSVPGAMYTGIAAPQGMAGMPVASVAQPYAQGMVMHAGMAGQNVVSAGVAVSGTGAPMASMEWAVPMPTRAKYQATFYQTDRARTGFLAGAQVSKYMHSNYCSLYYITNFLSLYTRAPAQLTR